jgi:hypothetical protein
MALRVLPDSGLAPGARGTVTLGLPARALAGRSVRPRVACVAPRSEATLVLRVDGAEMTRWTIAGGERERCLELVGQMLPKSLEMLELEAETSTPLWLDAVLADPARTAGGPR